MSAVHLATRDGKLCATRAAAPAVTTYLTGATCSRCSNVLTHLCEDESRAAAERRRWAAMGLDCEAVGIGHLWERVADGATPADRMIRDLVGTVAHYFVEVSA